MKLLSLVLYRIRGQIKEHKMIVLLFFLGIILADLVFLFFYGNYSSTKLSQALYSFDYQNFLVFPKQAEPLAEERLHCLDEFGVQEVRIAGKADIEERIIPLEVKSAKDTMEIRAYLYNGQDQELFFPLFESVDEEGDRVILSMQYKMMEEMLLNGEMYQVEKQVSHFEPVAFLIPVRTFLRQEYPVTNLKFILDHIPTAEEVSAVEEQLRQAFPGSMVITPQYTENLHQRGDLYGTVQNSMLYVLSVVSLLFLFSYLLSEGAYEDAIYLAAGATRKKVFLLLLLEIILLCAAAAVCATAIHVVFYDSIFANFNMFENLTYNAFDYVLAFAISLLLGLLTALPFVANYFLKSAYQLKNRYQK